MEALMITNLYDLNETIAAVRSVNYVPDKIY